MKAEKVKRASNTLEYKLEGYDWFRVVNHARR